MSLKYRPFAAIGFTVLLSLFWFIYFSEQFVPVFMCAGLLLVVVSLSFRSLRERLVPFYIAGSLLISGIIYYSTGYSSDLAENYKDSPVMITGTLTEETTYSDSRYYYLIDLDSVAGDSVDGKLRLSMPIDIDAEISDVISVEANVYEIGTDSREVQLYYRSKGVVLGAYQNDTENLEIRIDKSNKFVIRKVINDFKNSIVESIQNNIYGERGATVVAMLLGDKSGLSTERIDSFREAGIAPIFAVSGLHLSIWIMGLFSFLQGLGVKKRLTSVVTILFTVFFMILTGLTPSVCRSGIMMILFLCGNFFYRKADAINSLGFVSFILCMIQPFTAVDTGFLLSFSATLGIVTLMPVFEKYLFSKMTGNAALRLAKSILSTIAVSVSASAAVLPLTILLIGRVSVYSVVSNFLMSFIATICMVTGGLGALLSFVPAVSDILFSVSSFLSGLLLRFVDLICSAPFTLIGTANLFWKIGAIAAVGVIVFAVFNFKGKNIFKCVCIGLCINIIVFSLASHFYYDGLTQIRILNVKNGISAVAYNNSEKIVVTGKADEYSKQYRISDTLDLYNLRDPDLLLLADKKALQDSSNYTLIKNYDFSRVVLPYADQSVESVVSAERLHATPKASIEVFENDTVRYETCDEYSLALAEFNDTKILFLFDSKKKAEISEEYLDADILVCAGYIPYCIKPERYDRVLLCCSGKTAETVSDYVVSCGGAIQTIDGMESIVVNIRGDSYKIFASEG